MTAKGFVEIDVNDWTKLKERVSALEVLVQQLIDTLNQHVQDEKNDMEWIREKMSTYRPPWAIVSIILFLTSLCVGLIVHSVF